MEYESLAHFDSLLNILEQQHSYDETHHGNQ